MNVGFIDMGNTFAFLARPFATLRVKFRIDNMGEI